MNNLEAEQSVIGSLLIIGLEGAEHIYRLNLIGPDIFTDDLCKTTYRAIQGLSEQSQPIDLVMVGNQINATPEVRRQLTNMAEFAPNLSNINGYISILEQRYKHRKILELASNLQDQVDNHAPPDQIVGYTQNQLMSLITPEAKQLTLKQSIKSTIDYLQRRFESSEMFGVPSGFSFLDHALDGLQPEEMSVLSGNPGSGKTTLASNIAVVAAKTKPVIFFSMEMGHHQLNKRMIASGGSIPMQRLTTGGLVGQDWENLTTAVNTLTHLDGKLFIDYEVGIDSEYIRLKANEIKMRCGDLGLVIVDYHGNMKQRKGETRLDSSTRNAIELNRLKKELGCHVLVIAQLNKDVVKSGKQPNQGDLDYGQQLQKDADNIWFLYVNEQLKEDNVIKFYSDKARSSQPFTVYLENQLQYNRLKALGYEYKEKDKVTNLGFAKGT